VIGTRVSGYSSSVSRLGGANEAVHPVAHRLGALRTTDLKTLQIAPGREISTSHDSGSSTEASAGPDPRKVGACGRRCSDRRVDAPSSLHNDGHLNVYTERR